MRPLYITAVLSVAIVVLAQDSKRLVISSHDRVDGPFAGEYQVADLQVFENGRVLYVEEAAKTMGTKPERSAYETTIGPDVVERLAELLNRGEIRSLPKKVTSKIQPLDFSWQKSLRINRAKTTQRVQIENFYPFLNAHESVYPQALIELECSLQDIKAVVAKRPPLKDEQGWCDALLTASKSPRSSVASASNCPEDLAEPKIIAGEGWGPVRVGATSEMVEAVLGKGQLGSSYAELHFKEYAPRGVEVSFENTSNTVHAIFFYNGQRNDEQIGLFCGQTANGIGWQSSVDDVKNAYGKPTAEFSGTDWVRLVFLGIDFRFENGKMVRIGIPGK